MLVLRSLSPVSYDLCDQTVTAYHTDGKTYTRKIIRGAYLDYRKTQNVTKTGSAEASSFLLVIPGDTVPVAVGDKVMLGAGPACSTREDWAGLIPAKVPGLVVVQYVDPKYWRGHIVHTEAGG